MPNFTPQKKQMSSRKSQILDRKGQINVRFLSLLGQNFGSRVKFPEFLSGTAVITISVQELLLYYIFYNKINHSGSEEVFFNVAIFPIVITMRLLIIYIKSNSRQKVHF